MFGDTMKIIGYKGKLTEHDKIEVLGLLKLQKILSEKNEEQIKDMQNYRVRK